MVLMAIGMIIFVSVPLSAQKKSKKSTHDESEKITINIPLGSTTNCTVPIGTWSMKPADLVALLGTKKNVRQLRVDTTSHQTTDELLFDGEHVLELLNAAISDTLYTAVLFTYGEVDYTYRFKRRSGVLYTVTMKLAGDVETVNRHYNDVFYILDANSAFQRIASKRTDEERYRTTCGKWVIEIHNRKIKPTLLELKYYRQSIK